jgi:hypothetical protein
MVPVPRSLPILPRMAPFRWSEAREGVRLYRPRGPFTLPWASAEAIIQRLSRNPEFSRDGRLRGAGVDEGRVHFEPTSDTPGSRGWLRKV